jgi:uroporphyrinogen III methyltransferase/synthase
MKPSASKTGPLENKTALLACSAKKMSPLAEGLQALGATVLPFPIIEIRDIDDKRPLDAALASIDKYAWIIFTSAHGVLYFTRRFHERNIDREAIANIKICAIGTATAATLRVNGFKTDLVPEIFVAEGVLEALGKFCGGLENLSGQRVLIPRARIARNELPDSLASAGAHVDVVVCYETFRPELSDKELARYTTPAPDLAVFTSSSTVKNTMEALGNAAGRKLLEKTTVAAIGPITAQTIESFGKQVEIVPKESTIVSLIRSIEEYFSRQQERTLCPPDERT